MIISVKIYKEISPIIYVNHANHGDRLLLIDFYFSKCFPCMYAMVLVYF
jgi:hypothetical protein